MPLIGDNAPNGVDCIVPGAWGACRKNIDVGLGTIGSETTHYECLPCDAYLRKLPFVV
jgi:hypothetical protein